jgi:hypothetical protein
MGLGPKASQTRLGQARLIDLLCSVNVRVSSERSAAVRGAQRNAGAAQRGKMGM